MKIAILAISICLLVTIIVPFSIAYLFYKHFMLEAFFGFAIFNTFAFMMWAQTYNMERL